jgi:putative (di)nucleoside polyphosphate hydrolase
MKVASHGVLILCEPGEVLLGHATGTPHWDIPKGVGEPGESSVATAVRETREECGVLLDPGLLLTLGRFDHLRGKDLCLYAVRTPRLDTGLLHCTSMFGDRFGRSRAEMDGLCWAPFGELHSFCGKSLAAVLLDRLNLAEVLALSPAVTPWVDPGVGSATT